MLQPPLYRARRGNDERYLKNDGALESYLLEKALAGARLIYADGTMPEGTVLEGAELRREVVWLREATMQLRRLSTAAPRCRCLNEASNCRCVERPGLRRGRPRRPGDWWCG